MTIRYVHIISLFIAYLAITSCKFNSEQANCSLIATNGVDMYDYPDLAGKNDTDIYVYQLKNILNQHDSFIYVISGVPYLNQFNEPNLSLRYIGTETFRFSYVPWGGTPINISFNKTELTVKVGNKGSVYPISNYDKLDSIEKVKLHYLERFFFSNKDQFSERKRQYYDSLVDKYPELSSIQYYKSLYDKSLDYDSEKFSYTEKRIPLTMIQYCALIDSLNRTGFVNLPWKMDYPEAVTDGGGYTFEANMKNKYKYFVCVGLPIDTLPLTRFCQYLIDFSKLDKKIRL